MNFKKKIAAIVASGVVAIGGVGAGFGAWQFSQDASSTHKHDVNVGDFIFNTIQISESSESISGTLSKNLTTTHNIRCDGLDQGYQGQSIDLNNYVTVTPLEGVTTTNSVIFQVVDGDAVINGSTLTTNGDSSSITVRAYEDSYPDNYLILAFKNSTSENKAAHQGVKTYGNIARNNWSSYTSTSSTHTRTRTGTLSYTEKCSVCNSDLGSGSVTIDSSNYNDYATYDATGLGTTQSGSHNMVRKYGTISWNSWGSYSQYGSSQHRRTRTGTLSYTQSCSECGRSGTGGSITINSSNYSTYSTYNTSSYSYEQVGTCNDDDVSTSSAYDGPTSWGSWGSWSSWIIVSNATCTSSGTKRRTRSRTGTYYHYYATTTYSCDVCGRVDRSTGGGSVRRTTTDTDTVTDTIPATGHTLGSVFYTYTYTNQSQHLCKPTKKCSVCGANVGFGNNFYESHTWETTGYGKEVCRYCSGTKV